MTVLSVNRVLIMPYPILNVSYLAQIKLGKINKIQFELVTHAFKTPIYVTLVVLVLSVLRFLFMPCIILYVLHLAQSKLGKTNKNLFEPEIHVLTTVMNAVIVQLT